MAKIFLQYLAILTMEMGAQYHQTFAIVGSQFGNILTNPSKIAEDVQSVAIVAKFRQIWSLW